MTTPVVPIFIFEGEDLLVLRDLARLPLVLEPADVDVVEVWDSAGSRLRAVADRRCVRLEPLVSGQENELDDRLRRFCLSMGSSPMPGRTELRIQAQELAESLGC